MATWAQRRALVRERLGNEVGRIDKDAPYRIALTYPSPYAVAMSSLGFQSVYAMIQAAPGWCAERVFRADIPDQGSEDSPCSYETDRPLREFPFIAFSVAYELEIAGVATLLSAAGLAPLARERTPQDPVVIAGGPLTFSNPLPLLTFVDVLVLGEADEILPWMLREATLAADRSACLSRWASHPNILLPGLVPDKQPLIARADDRLLPTSSTIMTPHTELSGMYLVEVERGCSRNCRYCVMRRGSQGGMRPVPCDRILARVPPGASRIGLVGAAVSDHPQIGSLVDTLTGRGCRVGLSSLRPDRVVEPLVRALAAGSARTLTVALDGPSERLRAEMDRRTTPDHFRRAAELARAHRMERLKLYLMLGLPGETEQDIDECAEFVTELSRTIPITLGIAPFCAKRNTPLDGAPFAGVGLIQTRLNHLRRRLAGRAEVRASSARWAWVEHVLAQGGTAEGQAVLQAERRGGRFADYRTVLGELGHRPDP